MPPALVAAGGRLPSVCERCCWLYSLTPTRSSSINTTVMTMRLMEAGLAAASEQQACFGSAELLQQDEELSLEELQQSLS